MANKAAKPSAIFTTCNTIVLRSSLVFVVTPEGSLLGKHVPPTALVPLGQVGAAKAECIIKDMDSIHIPKTIRPMLFCFEINFILSYAGLPLPTLDTVLDITETIT